VSYLFFLYFLSGRTGLGMAAIARTDGWHPFFLDRLYGVVYANSAELLKIGNTALWFLPCLFVMQAGFLLIHRATGGHAGRIWAVLVCLSLFAYYEIAWRAATLPWSIDRACRDMVFFGLGWSLAGMQRAGKLLLPESVTVRAGIWAAGTAVAAAAGLLQGTVRFGKLSALYRGCVSGTAAWLAVAPLVRVKALAFLGRSALIIFGLHLLGQHLAAGTLSAAAGLFTSSAVVVMNDTLYAGIISLLEILITLPFAVLLTRALPGTFGGRRPGGPDRGSPQDTRHGGARRPMAIDSKIAFLGGGNMAEALIKGMLAAGVAKPDTIIVNDVSADRLDHLQKAYGIIAQKSQKDAVSAPASSCCA